MNYNVADLLSYWIKHSYLAANQRADAVLQPYGLGRTQWHILQYLAQKELTGQRELQNMLRVESATLTPIVSSMVQKGWIEQLPSVTDKRKKDLRLTATGLKLKESIADPVMAIEEAATKGLSAEEVESAREILKKVTRNLEKRNNA